MKPQWIQALYFKGKATVLATKRALLRCGYQAEAYVKNLEFVVAAQKKDVLSERIVELERELRAGLKPPPRKLQAAEERWLPQYAQKLQRYKFLVLEGSSCVGKTVWARSSPCPATCWSSTAPPRASQTSATTTPTCTRSASSTKRAQSSY